MKPLRYQDQSGLLSTLAETIAHAEAKSRELLAEVKKPDEEF
jgi:hypothetical protein